MWRWNLEQNLRGKKCKFRFIFYFCPLRFFILSGEDIEMCLLAFQPFFLLSGYNNDEDEKYQRICSFMSRQEKTPARICFEICRSIPVGTHVLAYDDGGHIGPAVITSNEPNTITCTFLDCCEPVTRSINTRNGTYELMLDVSLPNGMEKKINKLLCNMREICVEGLQRKILRTFPEFRLEFLILICVYVCKRKPSPALQSHWNGMSSTPKISEDRPLHIPNFEKLMQIFENYEKIEPTFTFDKKGEGNKYKKKQEVKLEKEMYSSHHHDHYGSKLVKSPKDYLEVSKKRKRASKNVRQSRKRKGSGVETKPFQPIVLTRTFSPTIGPMRDSAVLFCQEVLAGARQSPYAWPFLEPVDIEDPGCEDYLEIIKRPMDFSTIEAKLKSRKYVYIDEFLFDMNLIFRNCFNYNPPENLNCIVLMAQEVEKKFIGFLNSRSIEKKLHQLREIEKKNKGKMKFRVQIHKQTGKWKGTKFYSNTPKYSMNTLYDGAEIIHLLPGQSVILRNFKGEAPPPLPPSENLSEHNLVNELSPTDVKDNEPFQE